MLTHSSIAFVTYTHKAYITILKKTIIGISIFRFVIVYFGIARTLVFKVFLTWISIHNSETMTSTILNHFMKIIKLSFFFIFWSVSAIEPSGRFREACTLWATYNYFSVIFICNPHFFFGLQSVLVLFIPPLLAFLIFLVKPLLISDTVLSTFEPVCTRCN